MKKRTNLSIEENLLVSAKSLGINISSAAEEGITQAIRQAKRAQWLTLNKQAIDSSNSFIEQHGLPLDQHRHF